MDAAKSHGDGVPDLDFAASEADLPKRAGDLLRGARLFKVALSSRLDVRTAIVAGAFPYASLIHLTKAFGALDDADVLKALGISGQALRRQREAPSKPLRTSLASKMWLVAETFAKAIEVFGSRDWPRCR
jgi:uncharacterized protein (DUF2384 family)